MSLTRPVSLVLALAVASVVEAQVQVQIAPGSVAAGAKDLQSVYVRDSGIATERLALAERMEKLAEWDKAADIYQEIIDKYADRVVPRRVDDQNQVTQYMSVTLVVHEKLSGWPKEGLDAYRRRFEDIAAEKLANLAPGDATGLQKILSAYFPTDAGKEAGLRLIADGFERGEFSSCAWVGRRLLQMHPSLADQERANVLFQTALAEHLAGNDHAARQQLAELQTRHPDASGIIAGVERKLAEVLEAELQQPSTLSRTFRSDSWPMPFGTPDASAVPEQVSTGGARLFGVDVGGPPPRGSSAARNIRTMQLGLSRPTERRFGATTGILPAIDSGELFFQDNARVYAINLASGLPLTGWQQTYPGDKRGAYAIDSIPTPPGKQLGVHVTADRVFATLGQSDITIQPGNPAIHPTLVCLDRTTGKRVWGVALSRVKLPDEQMPLKDGAFYGTPLVVGDTVYSLARLQQRGGQFQECHLVALRLSDGGFKWSSYIASTSGNRFFNDDADFFGTGATAQMAYSDGRIYVLTNLGAVACVDAADGHTQWLNIYARENGDPNAATPARRVGFIQPSRSVFKPYTINPPIISDGRLFILPADSPTLFVYDAATGESLAEIPRRIMLPQISSRPENERQMIDMLLAVRGDQIIAGSRQAVMMFSWRTYDPRKSFMDNDGRFRVFIGPDTPGEDDREAIRGRPFVSQKYLLIPLADKMARLSIDEWRLDGMYPSNGKWDEEEQPGNILATPDHLIIAGPTRVTAYADLAVATAKLDEQIKAAPDAVDPYLRYAELLLAGGKPADAIGYLDRAAERLGGPGNLRSGDLRDRLFEICCSFAIKLQKATLSTGDVSSARNRDVIALIRKLYDRARDAADRPQQHVRFRLAMASLLRALKDDAAELAIHQEILANADWRSAPVVGRNGASTAAAEAELAVTEIINRAGPAIYTPYENAAAERFAAASKQKPNLDGDALLAVAEEFPTSKVATDALALAAEAYESTQPRKAAQALRRLLKRDLSNEMRLLTLESLARTYLATPGQVDTAVVRMTQAARLEPNATLRRPITLPNGRVLEKISYAAAQQLLQKYRSESVVRALPIFGVQPSSTVADQSTPPLQKPVEVGAASAIVKQQPDAARHDRVVVYTTNNAIAQYPVGTQQPLGRPVPFEETPIACAYSGDALIVVGPTQAMAVSADGERMLWKTALSALPGAEVAAAPASNNAQAGEDAELTEEELMQRQLRAQVQMVQVGNRRGVVNMNEDDAAVAAGGAERISGCQVLSDRLVFGTSSGRIVSIELATGRVTWQTRPSDIPVQRFLASEDFLVVTYSDTNPIGAPSIEVVVLDAITGQITLRETYEGQNMNRQLVNVALSRDGILVLMQPRSLRARDLYEPRNEWRQNAIGSPTGDGMPLNMSSGPEQLVITDDRVLVIYRSNTGQQSVRAFKLHDQLRPMRVTDPKTGRESDVAYSPRGGRSTNDNTALSIRTVGPMFYIWSQKSLAAYHLDNPQVQWSPTAQNMPIARDLVLTQDYAVLITQTPASPVPTANRVPAITLQMYSRTPSASGVESGLLEQRPKIDDRAGILVGQWQVANGAFYYITADQKLKMARATPAK